MRTADIVCGVSLAVVGLVALIDGLRLGIGWSTDGPEAGFFIFYLGAALFASAAGIALAAVRRKADPRTFVAPGQFRSVATVLIPAVVMVVLTHVVGLYVSGVLYLAAYMRWIGRHRWTTIAIVALAIPVATFLIFEVWFLVPLPKGPLEGRLGY